MWQIWRPVFGWKNLCPVIAADPFGFFVLMHCAEQPVSQQEVDDADPDDYPGITAESKAEDHGRLNSRIVAVDYGLPDESMIRERRAYYQDMAKRRSTC